MHCSETFPVHVGSGSNRSVERCPYVGFTPDFGRMAAMQRTDASGQKRTGGRFMSTRVP